MSADADFKNSSDSGSESRPVLVPGGNRLRATTKKKNDKNLVKTQQTKKVTSKLPESATDNTNNAASVTSCPSLGSGTGVSSVTKTSTKERSKQKGIRPRKVSPDRRVEGKLVSLETEKIVKRCHWITPNSDPLYVSFHDEEWGVPLNDDNKLFELLVFSQALGELSWPTLLYHRDLFRKFFDNFDIASVAKFTEKKILSLRVHGNLLLSEPKLHAVVENARQILKIQQEFGSFSNYCWGFVNHKQIKNSHRYGRQVPVKTPKAEVISKDLMRRGFRCVGPTVVYSFMQVTGIVNDHLITCFRYQECVSNVKRDAEPNAQEMELAKTLDNTCLSPV